MRGINKEEIEESIELVSTRHLKRMQKFLNFEASGFLAYFGSYWSLYLLSFVSGILMAFAFCAALYFIPVLFYSLYCEGKNGWLAAFGVIVIAPTAIIFIMAIKLGYSIGWYYAGLGFFYFYSLLLRFEVNDWIKERNSRNVYLLEKKRRETETKLYLEGSDKTY